MSERYIKKYCIKKYWNTTPLILLYRWKFESVVVIDPCTFGKLNWLLSSTWPGHIWVISKVSHILIFLYSEKLFRIITAVLSDDIGIISLLNFIVQSSECHQVHLNLFLNLTSLYLTLRVWWTWSICFLLVFWYTMWWMNAGAFLSISKFKCLLSRRV